MANIYSKDTLDQYFKFSFQLESDIAEIGEELGKIRGMNTSRWSFHRFEAESEFYGSKPDLENYYDGGDGNHYHFDTGSLYEDDMKKWEDSHLPTTITAYYYLGYESEYESISFPMNYLYTDWRTIEQAKIDEKKLQEQIKSEEQKKLREAQQDEKDRAEFARLKAKFGE